MLKGARWLWQIKGYRRHYSSGDAGAVELTATPANFNRINHSVLHKARSLPDWRLGTAGPAGV
jgi:hypothetical protein